MVPQQLFHLQKLLLILSFSFLPIVFSDLAADRETLLSFRAAVRGRTLRWNPSSPSPCQWEGVTCNTTIKRVTGLRLPGDQLSGQLPENTIGNLTNLRVLSLRHNFLSGPIPSDIGLCTELERISFENNRFSGDIPDGLFKLSNLLRVNLASNEFSGQISKEFNNLTRLKILYLQNNQFNGSLPQLNSLSRLREFNVSFNRLNGPIPERLSGFPNSSFLNNSLCGGPMPSCPKSNGGGGSKLSAGAIAGIVVGSLFGLIFLLLILLISWKIHRRGNQSTQAVMSPLPPSPLKPPEYDLQSPRPLIVKEDHASNNGMSNTMAGKEIKKRGVSNGGNDGLVFFGDGYQFFTLDELLRASAEVLGKGVLGTTYRAYLETGEDVVVKRLRNVCVSEDEFRVRVEKLGHLNHKNLLPLRAYFFGKDEKLLVFKSLPIGSLHSILHGPGRASLTWTRRCRIAVGAACGIEYLHSLGSNISHGNIKSSNVLLNRYYDPCLSEYCITKLVSCKSSSSLIGYGAPEVVDSRRVSQKADVYSLGVLLLELLTGKGPKTTSDEIDLPKWVQSVVQERWTVEVFDPDLPRHQNSEEQMVQLLHLAISCTSHVPEKRPLMKDVTLRIKEICEVPPSD